VSELRPDVVLLDIQLPDLDGFRRRRPARRGRRCAGRGLRFEPECELVSVAARLESVVGVYREERLVARDARGGSRLMPARALRLALLLLGIGFGLAVEWAFYSLTLVRGLTLVSDSCHRLRTVVWIVA